MGLEKIRQAVLAEAKTEATRILDSAKKTAAGLFASQKSAAEQEQDGWENSERSHSRAP